ncbi:DUF4058 family protein [Tautonia plasticadhaerens]|uniref:DUF4058 domain-containing protein n=1 Tax=Tautonia plasticadhaerens TaxID=2527974 RepID=A0A518HBB9_9BACT|nr:DUF4058 family protein [Tautonia plasticadhaerens]QDV38152.1 hypothetical protein ElP_61010 [Tautonia plasticadhaerens]
MPSPFPGMNPYFERPGLWQDFHTEFLSTLRRLLVPGVSPGYIVQIEEHIHIHDLAEGGRALVGRADLAVAESPGHGAGRVAAVIEAPATVTLPDQEVERQRYLEVRDRRSRELVTVVELLSPSNKRGGDDRGSYLAKRRERLRSPAHLVEIDLLRGGRPMPMEDRPECDYSVLVSRSERRRAAGLWPIRLRERLPVIPIPLKAPDGDATVDLQEVLHRTYDGPGYDGYLYDGAPEPALLPEADAWARDYLPAAR